MKKGESFKPSVKYQAVSLPKPLIDSIKDRIRDDPNYRSIAEFVKESIRFRLTMPTVITHDDVDEQTEKLEQIEKILETMGYEIKSPSSTTPVDLSKEAQNIISVEIKEALDARFEKYLDKLSKIKK